MNYFCSECGEDISEKVFNYSKENFGEILCLDCQKELSGEINLQNPQDRSFDYNMIKGRVAEALIEQLFLKLKYDVFRYGMENTIPGIMELLKGVRSDVSNTIRRMPDFVIQGKDRETYFVEVKFSKNEEFSLYNLKEKKYGPYPFPNAFFVIVSKKHIKAITYDQLKKGQKITPTCKNYLHNIKEFDSKKEVVKKFCEYAKKFFQGVD